MVRLNKRQTKAVERLFKKMDLLGIAFAEGAIEGEVVIAFTTWDDRSIQFTLQESGIVKRESESMSL